jgi:hypothetical protein
MLAFVKELKTCTPAVQDLALGFFGRPSSIARSGAASEAPSRRTGSNGNWRAQPGPRSRTAAAAPSEGAAATAVNILNRTWRSSEPYRAMTAARLPAGELAALSADALLENQLLYAPLKEAAFAHRTALKERASARGDAPHGTPSSIVDPPRPIPSPAPSIPSDLMTDLFASTVNSSVSALDNAAAPPALQSLRPSPSRDPASIANTRPASPTTRHSPPELHSPQPTQRPRYPWSMTAASPREPCDSPPSRPRVPHRSIASMPAVLQQANRIPLGLPYSFDFGAPSLSLDFAPAVFAAPPGAPPRVLSPIPLAVLSPKSAADLCRPLNAEERLIFGL